MSAFFPDKEAGLIALRPLKKTLFAAYDGFNDKRIKNIDKGSLFIVDGRTDGDHDARGQLFLWFCSIFVEVRAPDSVHVTMRGGIPEGPAVGQWIKKYGANRSERALEFDVSSKDVDKLAALGGALESIVAKGKSYPVKAYKYVCPRTAGSLDRLQEILSEYWNGIPLT